MSSNFFGGAGREIKRSGSLIAGGAAFRILVINANFRIVYSYSDIGTKHPLAEPYTKVTSAQPEALEFLR